MHCLSCGCKSCRCETEKDRRDTLENKFIETGQYNSLLNVIDFCWANLSKEEKRKILDRLTASFHSKG